MCVILYYELWCHALPVPILEFLFYVVSGDQVKHLLMKSGLPMPVLGHIWYVLCHAVHCMSTFSEWL